MNFQEFDYPTDVSASDDERKKNEGSLWDDNKKQLEKIDVLDENWQECRGEECCGPHQKFHHQKQLCMDLLQTDEPTEMENFDSHNSLY